MSGTCRISVRGAKNCANQYPKSGVDEPAFAGGLPAVGRGAGRASGLTWGRGDAVSAAVGVAEGAALATGAAPASTSAVVAGAIPSGATVGTGS